MKSLTKNRTFVLFFFTALFFGYSPFWVPFYVNLLQKKPIQTLGTLPQFEVPCNEPQTGISFCSNQYVIKRDLLPEDLSQMSIGLGHILVALSLGCYENGKFRGLNWNRDQNFSPNRNYQVLNTYHVFPLSMFQKCTEAIAIQSWVSHYDLRKGYYGGFITIGDALVLDREKRIIEYIHTGIPQHLAFTALIILLVFRSFYQAIGMHQQTRLFFSLVPLWFFTFLFTSGTMQILIPIDTETRIFARIGVYFSIITHFFTALYSFKKYKMDSRFTALLEALARPLFRSKHNDSAFFRLFTSRISLFVIFGALSPIYSIFFGYVSLAIALSILISCPKREFDLLFFSIAYTLAVLKIFNVYYGPQSNLTFYYVGLAFCYEIYDIVQNDIKKTIYSFIENSTSDSKFAAQVVHDLKSPLFVLRILLSKANWGNERGEVRETVLKAIDQMNIISKELLRKHKKDFSISDNSSASIEQVGEILRNQSVLLDANVKIRFQEIPEITKNKLKMRKVTFERIILNILSNARECPDVSEIQVQTDLVDENTFQMIVINNGSSPSNEVLSEILKNGGTYGKPNGTGMGLTFCQKEISSCGGDFRIEEKCGVTIVSVRIPLDK